MKYSKATVIVNPASGAGKVLGTAKKVFEFLKGRIKTVDLVWTRAAGVGSSLATAAVEKGSDLIVAVGGDGTVNEVVNGLFRGKERIASDCVLAIIPVGTSSSLAKELGIPRGWASADLIANGSERVIDLLVLKWLTSQERRVERLATTVANFGLGGAVAISVGARMKKLGALVAFGSAAAVQLMRYRGRQMAVEVDAQEIARSRILCAIVANSQWEGGGMRVAPEARPDDGLLDVILVEDLPLASRLRHFPKVYRGTHIRVPAVTCAKGTRAAIRSSRILPFEFDGEWSECRECTIEVIPKALRVVVPRDAGVPTEGFTKRGQTPDCSHNPTS